MFKISLTKGKEAIVDDNMSHLANFKWHCDSYGYATRNFYKDSGKQGLVRMHHCIVGYPLHKMEVDHIDNNPSNNLRSNLRIVSRRINQGNQKRKKEGKLSSKFVGVYFSNIFKKWVATIQVNKKRIHLGLFSDEQKAADSYNYALKEY